MSMLIGSVLLIVGIVLLMIGFYVAFSIASDPGGYLNSRLPDVKTTSEKGPRSEFRLNITDFTVTVQDVSKAGDASINNWQWEWGDGQTASGNNPPQHVYTGNFSGSIRLTVKDSNGKESSALGTVDARAGQHSSGNSMPDVGDIGNAIDVSQVLAPFTVLPMGLLILLLVFAMLFIVWLVGASILKAGWNLIRPRPETIKVRIKPKDLQAEPMYPTTYASAPQTPPPYFPPQMPPQQPPPPMQPPSQEFGFRPPPPEM